MKNKDPLSILILMPIIVIASFIILFKDKLPSFIIDTPKLFDPKALVFCAAAVVLTVAASQIYKIVKHLDDIRIVKTTNYILDWIDNANENDIAELKKKYQKTDRNVGLGLLLKENKPLKFYLAFSDEGKLCDKLGKEFEKRSNEIPYIYCHYSYEELHEKLPLAILAPDLGPMYPDDPNSRQKTHQTCSERKIIANFMDEHSDELHSETAANLCLVLFTKFAPCEFCTPFIQEIKERYEKNLQIKVLHIDNINEMLNHKKELIDINKKYSKTLKNMEKLWLMFPKETKKAEKAQTVSTRDKVNEKLLKEMKSIAYAQCFSLIKNKTPQDIVKQTLKHLKLSDEQIDEIMKDVYSQTLDHSVKEQRRIEKKLSKRQNP